MDQAANMKQRKVQGERVTSKEKRMATKFLFTNLVINEHFQQVIVPKKSWFCLQARKNCVEPPIICNSRH